MKNNGTKLDLVKQNIIEAIYNHYNMTKKCFEHSDDLIKYEVIDGKKYLTEVSKYFYGKLVIPQDVVGIRPNACLRAKNVTEIEILGNIESIGNKAFSKCSKLTEVHIKGNVKKICEYAFADCNKLSVVIFDKDVLCIQKFTFFNCTHLASVIFYNTVHEIANYAFKGCNLKNIFVDEQTNVQSESFDAKCKIFCRQEEATPYMIK